MKRKIVAILGSVAFVAVAIAAAVFSQTGDNAQKVEATDASVEKISAPVEVVIKPTDVKIPADLQEIYDTIERPESCDPTPGDQGKGVFAKLLENIHDVMSGEECQIAGLRNPLESIPSGEFPDDNRFYAAGIIDSTGTHPKDGKVTFYLENLDDAERIYARFLIGLTADEIASLPDDVIAFTTPETNATVLDLLNAQKIVFGLPFENGESRVNGKLGVYEITTSDKAALDDLPASAEPFKKFIKINYDPNYEAPTLV
jgi:hypothetical protein